MNGAEAETQALGYLQAQGLKLIARNYRCRGGELDLVMDARGTLVMVEVRARSSTAFGGAAASVDARKQARIVLAARSFLAAHPRYAQQPVRFDVLAFEGDRIEWIPAAFEVENG